MKEINKDAIFDIIRLVENTIINISSDGLVDEELRNIIFIGFANINSTRISYEVDNMMKNKK